ncbi:MAG: nucleoside triphosphate pyrophosphohydrolase family protein [Candidatus Nealsonbacteria bacterium]
MSKNKIKSLKEYQRLCQKTALKFKDKDKEIFTWGLGLAGEAGDVAGCIKKTISHKNNQKQGIKENLGDVLWYAAMICNHFGWDLEDVLEGNIIKIQKRYPKGFTKKSAKRKPVNWNEK